MGGIFSDAIGWRWGFYTTAILNGAVLALALWALPPDIGGGPFQWVTVTRLHKDTDCGDSEHQPRTSILRTSRFLRDACRTTYTPATEPGTSVRCIGIAASVQLMDALPDKTRPAGVDSQYSLD